MSITHLSVKLAYIKFVEDLIKKKVMDMKMFECELDGITIPPRPMKK